MLFCFVQDAQYSSKQRSSNLKVIRTPPTNSKDSPGPTTNPYCQIRLTKGKFAIVDAADFEWLNKHYWRAVQSSHGWYAKCRYWINGKQHDMFMHRMIAGTHKDQVCHHINGDGLDNRRCNLQNLKPSIHEQHHAELRISKRGHQNTNHTEIGR